MKKTLLAFALLLISSLALAGASSIQLQRGDVGLSLIEAGKIVRTQMVMHPHCPRGARCLPRNEMTLAFTLACLNRLGPVTSRVVYNERTAQYDLFVTATEIINEASFRARCVRPNVQMVKLTVAGGMDKHNTNLVMATRMDNSLEPAPTPVRCTREYMPVCGMTPMKCPAGQICPTVMVEKTYSNKCMMNAAGATLVHEGACVQ